MWKKYGNMRHIFQSEYKHYYQKGAKIQKKKKKKVASILNELKMSARLVMCA